eukprot:scaffold1007_cov364-Prasinococcus_capsulatus_cf.AAC.6
MSECDMRTASTWPTTPLSASRWSVSVRSDHPQSSRIVQLSTCSRKQSPPPSSCTPLRGISCTCTAMTDLGVGRPRPSKGAAPVCESTTARHAGRAEPTPNHLLSLQFGKGRSAVPSARGRAVCGGGASGGEPKYPPASTKPPRAAQGAAPSSASDRPAIRPRRGLAPRGVGAAPAARRGARPRARAAAAGSSKPARHDLQ